MDTHRLGHRGLADLIRLGQHFTVQVVQDGRRVPDTFEVDHGLDVSEMDATENRVIVLVPVQTEGSRQPVSTCPGTRPPAASEPR